jgi:signal recognition particle subunit SRP19
VREIIIWPVYLDGEKSRKEGRKVPKELGVKNPKLKDIFNALKKMGYSAEIVKNKSYPKEHWETLGYIKVNIDNNISKMDLIKKVCKNLS